MSSLVYTPTIHKKRRRALISFNISKDMSDFNIQLSFKLNIEPPENMSAFNIQPSLKLRVKIQKWKKVNRKKKN